MSDTEQSVWTPHSCEPHQGEKECNYDGCHAGADWDVELLGEGPRQGQKGLVRVCDGHVAEYWGYHPNDEELVTDGGTGTDHSLYLSESDTAHVDSGELVFHKDMSERAKMLCGAVMKQRSGMALNGHQLTDWYRDGTLCGKCLDKLRERGSTIPGFMKDGELVPHVTRCNDRAQGTDTDHEGVGDDEL